MARGNLLPPIQASRHSSSRDHVVARDIQGPGRLVTEVCCLYLFRRGGGGRCTGRAVAGGACAAGGAAGGGRRGRGAAAAGGGRGAEARGRSLHRAPRLPAGPHPLSPQHSVRAPVLQKCEGDCRHLKPEDENAKYNRICMVTHSLKGVREMRIPSQTSVWGEAASHQSSLHFFGRDWK